MRTIQRLTGQRHIGTTALYCEVSDEAMRNAVELVGRWALNIRGE
jgi:site-specific recombinase XerD